METEIKLSNIITDETPSYKTVADLFGFATPVSTKKPLTPLPPPPPLSTSQINDIAFLQTYTRTTPPPIKKLQNYCFKALYHILELIWYK
jgi:hypothetical protein